MILNRTETKDEECNSIPNKMEGLDKLIDVQNAYRITERLAFPRLIGSKSEKKAIETVVDEFKNAGFVSINRQKFMTSFHNFIYSRYIFLLLGTGLIFLGLSFYISAFLTLCLIFLSLYVSYKALKTATSTKVKLSRHQSNNYETENIWVDLESKNSNGKVIFIAHWDSKSQSFPSTIRVMIFLIFTFSSLLLYLIFFTLSIINILINFNIPFLNNVLLDTCIIIAIIGGLNYFNKTGNLSPGAFDNAAGIGIIIELARYYKITPPHNLDLTFFSPGSEELNLGGAIRFIEKLKNELSKDTTFFINLDLIGGSEVIRLTSSYGIPRKISSKKLNTLFKESAEENQIRMRDVYSPTGSWSDFMPIVQEGFEACWLGSQPGLKYVHTRKDNMSLVSKEGLTNIITLCIDVVKKLDLEFNQ